MKNRNKLGDRQQGCIEPVIGGKVYDYYNGVLSSEEVRGFERHLVRCHHCEKVILELDHALAVLNDEQGVDSASAGDPSSGIKAVERKAARKTKR